MWQRGKTGRTVCLQTTTTSTLGNAPLIHGPLTLKAPAMICSSSSKYIATCTTTDRRSQLAHTLASLLGQHKKLQASCAM